MHAGDEGVHALDAVHAGKFHQPLERAVDLHRRADTLGPHPVEDVVGGHRPRRLFQAR
jgi:hypothetical protein